MSKIDGDKIINLCNQPEKLLAFMENGQHFNVTNALEQELLELMAAQLKRLEKSLNKTRDKFDAAEWVSRQTNCNHLKGGSHASKQSKDYAVFPCRIGERQYIRCAICGMKWYTEDTVEYLVRRGEKIVNHTKLGWREACAMVEFSQ